MHTIDKSRWQHHHDFVPDLRGAERSTRNVILFTAVMMVAELVAGLKLHSMALFADGCHMSTHIAAFVIAAVAYAAARKNARNPRFSFGAGKVGVLGAYTSAIILSGIALLMAGESVERLLHPAEIRYDEAIAIAALGLLVNGASAWMLQKGGHEHAHGHDHPHPHGSHEDDHPSHPHAHPGASPSPDQAPAPGHAAHRHDINLKAAYVHVLADAVTSVLAIIALVAGKFRGWAWLDPAMGLVGAAVILSWASTLIRRTLGILVDRIPDDSDLPEQIHQAVESDHDSIVTDLHLWQPAADKFAAIVSVVAHSPKPPEHYKAILGRHAELVHVTVEVNRCPGHGAAA